MTGSWIVPREAGPARLDQFLLSLHAGETRSRIQSWIRAGWVRVGGKAVKTGYAVRPGEVISLEIPPQLPVTPQPEDIPLRVLYEDADLVVVMKPAGMVCHAGAGVRRGTLVNALLHRFGLLEGGDPMRPGIVHRLDKLTSGLVVVARRAQAHRILAEQFKQRQVRKVYWALVHGHPAPKSGTIDMPVGRDSGNRQKMSVRARRSRSAITHYEARETIGSLAVVSIRIETGRTHQIRVHLAHKGHPVVGDAMYGGGRDRTLPPELARAVPKRYCLHAEELAFSHPTTGRPLAFAAPLPEELESFLQMARSCSDWRR